VPKKALKGYIEWKKPAEKTRMRLLDTAGREAKRMSKCRNELENVGRGWT
jgi:hypothetical protein